MNCPKWFYLIVLSENCDFYLSVIDLQTKLTQDKMDTHVFTVCQLKLTFKMIVKDLKNGIYYYF